MNEVILPAAQTLRHIALVPEPFPAESFGSWLARLAAAHHAEREVFARAMLAEARAPAATLQCWNLDSDPPPALIEALCHRTGRSRSQLESLRVHLGAAIAQCTEREPEHYCPICWNEDVAHGARHIRRVWRERWTVMCDLHEVRLRVSRLPVERLLCGTVRHPDWFGEVRAPLFPAALCTELTRMQRLIRARELGCPLPPEVRERAQVLRDVAILAGTAFEEGSLIDWSVSLEPDLTRKLHWSDPRGHVVAPPEVREPRGTLEVRQLALRVATLLLRRMFEIRGFAQSEDVAIWARLNLLPRRSDLSMACGRMVRTWPDGYRALWELAFGWPGRGGACHFARRYGSQLPETSGGHAAPAEAIA